jgi:RNA-directed DNA polymerase
MYEIITSWSNLLLAYTRAAKGKRGHANVAGFEHRLEDNLLQLQHELQDFSYRPGSYDSFYIHEPKRRLISAAPFRDRVVHHALCNLIEPLFERSFIFDSYANRLKKGTHRALNRAQGFARRYPFVLQIDVRQFFPSIDHILLRAALALKIHDSRVLWLCDQIIKSGIGILSDEYEMAWFPGDDLMAANRPRGLPIGNLSSQFWANVYLNGFDHFVMRHLRPGGYLRYVDDMLLFRRSKAELWDDLATLEAYLGQLRLTIHPGAHPIPVSEGIPFLGFQIFPQKRRLKRRKGLYYQRKLRQMLGDYAVGKVAIEDVNASALGWVNHVRYANTVGLRKALFRKQKILKREK